MMIQRVPHRSLTNKICLHSTLINSSIDYLTNQSVKIKIRKYASIIFINPDQRQIRMFSHFIGTCDFPIMTKE